MDRLPSKRQAGGKEEERKGKERREEEKERREKIYILEIKAVGGLLKSVSIILLRNCKRRER